MILTDSKKTQAKTVIGLESVAGVSVTSFQDGLFCLHLSEVSAGWGQGLIREKGAGLTGLGRAGGDGAPTSSSGPSLSPEEKK